MNNLLKTFLDNKSILIETKKKNKNLNQYLIVPRIYIEEIVVTKNIDKIFVFSL
jgi:hypothetical protein